jgi:hypothetical protein
MYVINKTRTCSCNHSWQRKGIRITYSVFVFVFVALVNQHGKRMRLIMWPRWLHDVFPHSCINGKIFGNKHNERKMCFDFLYKSAWNISLSKKHCQILAQIYTGIQVNCLLFVSDFNETWHFLAVCVFSKNTQISNLIKIHPVKSELSHADGRTGRTWRRYQ